jgi:hypothetical protein
MRGQMRDQFGLNSDVTQPAVPGSAGISARDAYSKYKTRAHGFSRAEMPALPGTASARHSLNRGFRVCLMEEKRICVFCIPVKPTGRVTSDNNHY